jgi:hypothetical protein
VGTITTRPNEGDVDAFLDAVADERRRTDSRSMCRLMQQITGAPPTMWGTSIVGFGNRPYTNTTGTNDWFVVGFSPRKQALTVYGVYDGYAAPNPLFDELGPHTTGKGCLYIKRLSDVDVGVLERLIREAWTQGSNA